MIQPAAQSNAMEGGASTKLHQAVEPVELGPSRAKRPIEPGWMSLRTWAGMQNPPCEWERALAYANPRSKRTAQMFNPLDVDRRTNQDIHVWYQPPHPITGKGRPRFIRRPKSEPSVHEMREGHQLEV